MDIRISRLDRHGAPARARLGRGSRPWPRRPAGRLLRAGRHVDQGGRDARARPRHHGSPARVQGRVPGAGPPRTRGGDRRVRGWIGSRALLAHRTSRAEGRVPAVQRPGTALVPGAALPGDACVPHHDGRLVPRDVEHTRPGGRPGHDRGSPRKPPCLLSLARRGTGAGHPTRLARSPAAAGPSRPPGCPGGGPAACEGGNPCPDGPRAGLPAPGEADPGGERPARPAPHHPPPRVRRLVPQRPHAGARRALPGCLERGGSRTRRRAPPVRLCRLRHLAALPGACGGARGGARLLEGAPRSGPAAAGVATRPASTLRARIRGAARDPSPPVEHAGAAEGPGCLRGHVHRHPPPGGDPGPAPPPHRERLDRPWARGRGAQPRGNGATHRSLRERTRTPGGRGARGDLRAAARTDGCGGPRSAGSPGSPARRAGPHRPPRPEDRSVTPLPGRLQLQAAAGDEERTSARVSPGRTSPSTPASPPST